ncbi:MAG: tRNA (N6-threonylcarbamoyladenosine(37)-N6)-methyltransferase TrmO [Phycisphaerales bacterium]|nr:MAG: tRNA (N6-threonylcarbamoyladenosine(37)-N6)-methyltransferase TrmO [Phycisphaerales bacterium]
MEVKAIGTIHSPFQNASGVPIQPAFAEGAEGTVEVAPEYAEALADLAGFERIWLLYWFDRAAPFKARVKPYLDDQAHGLFATRAPARPNPIGLSCVKLLSVEGATLHVGGIDILDGTPLLDIKPYARRFDHFEVTRSGWIDATHKGITKSDDRFFGAPG